MSMSISSHVTLPALGAVSLSKEAQAILAGAAVGVVLAAVMMVQNDLADTSEFQMDELNVELPEAPQHMQMRQHY